MYTVLTNKVSRTITTLALVTLISAIAFAPAAQASPFELVINYAGNFDNMYQNRVGFSYHIVESQTNQWKDINKDYTNLLIGNELILGPGISRFALGDFDTSNAYIFGVVNVQKTYADWIGVFVEPGFTEHATASNGQPPWMDLSSITDWDTGISGRIDIVATAFGNPQPGDWVGGASVGTWTLRAMPAPEPSSIILLSLGLGAIAYTVRKRRCR